MIEQVPFERIIEVAKKLDLDIEHKSDEMAYRTVLEGISVMNDDVIGLLTGEPISGKFPRLRSLNTVELKALIPYLLLLKFEFLLCLNME